MQASDISTLRRKRGNIIGQITSLNKFLDNYRQSGQRSVNLVRAHLKGLHEHWKRFNDLQDSLEEEDESEVSRRYEIENTYYAAVARAEDIIHEDTQVVSSARDINQSPTTSITAPMAIKLPEMRLPTFDGTIEQWHSFYDIFSSIIDRNDDLTPVQKLQYLRASLTGRAAACIQSLSTTDSNYADAIDILKHKFDCTRRVVLKHCDAIRDIPKLAKDSPEALGDLVDTINQHTRALKNLGVAVDSWSAIIISLILSKISQSTAWNWELTLSDKKVPSYTHLLEFLEKRANCAVTKPDTSPVRSIRHRGGVTEFQRPTRHVQSQPFTRQAFLTVRDRHCPICEGSHEIWHCNSFKSLSVLERYAAVEKAALCSNCLGEDHHINLCRSGSCRVCHRRHHTWLHTSDLSPKEAAIPSTSIDSGPTSGSASRTQSSKFS